MLSVLLVDDEKTVRNGIKMMIPWDELGFSIIGEASDGDDGLDKLMTLSPDIVIADIRMPGRTGLQMLEEAKKQGFNGKSIILSGYSDFSYAQAAITVGVKKFLLKPVDEDELISELLRISDEIKEERKGEFVRQKGSEYLQSELIRTLFLGNADAEVVAQSSLPQDAPYTVALISVSDCVENVYEILDGVENPLHVKLDLEHTLGLLFIGFTAEKITDFMKSITVEFAAVGKTVDTILEISESYRNADEYFRKKFLFMHSGVLTPESYSRYTEETGEPEVIIEKLLALITVNDTDKLIDHLDKLHRIFMSGRYTPEAIRLTYVQAADYIVKSAAKVGTISRLGTLPTADDISRISHMPYLYDINAYVTGMFCGISDNVFGDTTQSNIDKIVRYIDANFRSELRLEGLAALFGYNAAYLGKIFHKYTGDTFNNYLDDIRITEAKRLLDTGEYRVYEVAEKVGFTNINYFHNKFKKVVGTSPMAYKRSENRILKEYSIQRTENRV